jgi:hypothetical protein
MLPLWSHGTLQERVPKFEIAEREETIYLMEIFLLFVLLYVQYGR